MTDPTRTPPRVAVIGGGPAGLMAADTARAAGIEVHVFEAMGSVGRKFLIAGKGGLNLTHSETRPGFDARYRERAAAVGTWLDDFDADALRAWALTSGHEVTGCAYESYKPGVANAFTENGEFDVYWPLK